MKMHKSFHAVKLFVGFTKHLSNIFVLFTFLHCIEIATSDLIEIILENKNTAPLALYLQNNNEEMVLAKPYRNLEDENRITFVYDDTDNESIVLACPPHTDTQLQQQNEWNDRKARGLHGIKEILLFPGDKINCEEEIIPTIWKDRKRRCHQSHSKRKGHLYRVGYLVWNEIKQKVEFLTVYKFCYSKKNGTLYTVHTIRLPHLLKFGNYYLTQIVYPSIFDKNTNNIDFQTWLKEQNEQNLKKYQFVNYYDMAVYSWKITTLFSFNYITVKNFRMKKYLNTIDNYIRYFAKKNNIELTVYSGKYLKRISKEVWDIVFEGKKYAPVTDKFVWKVIHDNEYNTIILITHLKPYEHCNFLCAYNPITLDHNVHGCTYTCQVDKTLLSNLGLENFKSKGFLDIDLPSVVNSKKKASEDDGPAAIKNRRNTVNISSFLKTYHDFRATASAYEAGENI